MKKILFIFFMIHTLIFGHPHIFFENEYKVNINNNILKNIEVTLILDELNTTLYFPDTPENTLIQKKDIEFYKDIVSHFHFKYNDENCDIPIFKSATISDGSLILKFYLKFDKVLQNKDFLEFSIYDKEYYYTYDYNKYSFEISDNSKIKKFKVEENKKKAFYFNMIYPIECRMEF